MSYDIKPDGKTLEFEYAGRKITYHNQQSREWTHPYEWENNGSNLHNAGCGVFALAFVAEWMSGARVDPEWLADFSCECGGRGDDGTDRPALLSGVASAGLDERFGFRYEGDGLVNDHEKLWAVLSGGGCAMCNLRVGHIVAVVGCRERSGERQILVIDSDCESADPRIRDFVREVAPCSAVTNYIYNAAGVAVGFETAFAMFWTPLDMAADFNLLYKR